MNETSLSLLGRARRPDDAESWQRLVSLYTPLLKAWMRRSFLQDADVDDLVQEVLLTVSRELPNFEHSGRPGAFRHWLRTVAVHRLQHHWRSRQQQPLARGASSFLDELNQLEDDASAASREWNAEHDRHVVSQLLEQVRPRFQPQTWEAFRRQMLDGQRPDAVAAQMGIPIQAVYVARSRVLSALRREAEGLIDHV